MFCCCTCDMLNLGFWGAQYLIYGFQLNLLPVHAIRDRKACSFQDSASVACSLQYCMIDLE